MEKIKKKEKKRRKGKRYLFPSLLFFSFFFLFFIFSFSRSPQKKDRLVASPVLVLKNFFCLIFVKNVFLRASRVSEALYTRPTMKLRAT